MKPENLLRLEYFRNISMLTIEQKKEQLEKLIQEEGLSYRELSRMISVPVSTIFGWIRKTEVDKGKARSLENNYHRIRVTDYDLEKEVSLMVSHLVNTKDIKLNRKCKENVRILILRLNQLL